MAFLRRQLVKGPRTDRADTRGGDATVPAVTEPSPEHAPSPDRPPTVRNVQYRGAPLDSERGPGLGCFRFQLAVLVILVVLTPISVNWGWPTWASAALLFATIGLLLVAGQTIIFLLRLVAADRRAAARRRPLASRTPTVGEIEDEAREREDDPPPGEDEPRARADEDRVRE